EQRKYRAKLDRDDMLSLEVALSLLEQYEGSYLADSLGELRDEITCWWQAEAMDREEAKKWSAQKFHSVRFLPYKYAEDGEVFAEVVLALASGLKLEFHYRPLSGRAGPRKVRPYSLIFYKGAFYLVALVDHAKPGYDPTCFMLARMSEAKALEGETYVYPKDWDPQSFFPRIEGLLKGETGRLEALFAGRLYEYLKLERQWPEGTEIKREGDEVRFGADLVLNEELLNWLLGFGGEVEVLGPPEFRKWIAEKARAAAKRYR
ncbi:MAG: WYL domain-containing protein, partial [Polyangia bacterium]|nr:WYL domain-containing protein [Polyangia bacterium]